MCGSPNQTSPAVQCILVLQVASNGITQEVRAERDEAAWAAAQPPQDIPSSPEQQQAHAISNTGEAPARKQQVCQGHRTVEQHCIQPGECLLQVFLPPAVEGWPGDSPLCVQLVLPASSCGCS